MAYVAIYATESQLEKDAGGLNGKGQAEIARALEAASRNLDEELGQRFGLSDAPEARTFYPEFLAKRLTVDPIANTTGFQILVDEDQDGSFADETAWAATDYELRPLNAVADGEPYTHIHIPIWSTKAQFQPGRRVQVTANWGWPVVPEAIQTACIEWAKLILLLGPRATQQINELNEVEQLSPAAASRLKHLLDPYYRAKAITI